MEGYGWRFKFIDTENYFNKKNIALQHNYCMSVTMYYD